MRRTGLYLLIVMSCAFIASNSGVRGIQAAQATPDADAPYIVESVEELPYKAGSAILSPDGKRVAGLGGGKKLCVYTTATKAEQCITDDQFKASIDANSVVWSPDSQQIAFTQNFFQRLIASQVWLLDTKTMTIKRLTGDGQERKFSIGADKAADNPSVDVAPHWSANGKQIYFIRCEAPCSSQVSAAIYSFDLVRGKESKIAVINTPMFFTYQFDMSKDGRSAVYLVYTNKKDDPSVGIYRFDIQKKSSTQIAKVRQLVNVQLSADEQYVLGYSPLAEGQYGINAPESYHRFSPIKGGETFAVDADRPGFFPGWGPKGSEFAYIMRDIKAQTGGLYIAPKPGSAGKLVYSGMLASGPNWFGVQWGADNTILVYEGKGYELIHLKKR